MKRALPLLSVFLIALSMRADAFLFSTGGGPPPPVGFLSGHTSGSFAGHTAGMLLCHSCQPSFRIVMAPTNPSVVCNLAPAALVSALSTVGGDGNAVTFSLTAGDTTDFAVNGTSVAPGASGISSGTCNTTVFVTVTATQP